MLQYDILKNAVAIPGLFPMKASGYFSGHFMPDIHMLSRVCSNLSVICMQTLSHFTQSNIYVGLT